MIINPYAFSASDAYRAAVMADSPVAYWRLGEASGSTAADETGSYNGTYENTPTLSAAGAVTGNDAVTLNGTDEYVSVAAAPISGTLSAWTLECWAKGAAQDGKYILSLGSSSSNNPVIAIASGLAVAGQSTGNLRPFVRDNSNSNTWGIDGTEAYGTAFDSAWHHLVLTYDGTTGKAYIDGSQVGSKNFSAPATTLNRTAIGALLRASPALYFSGSIDEAAIYNIALSAARISAHYDAA